ncbi:uncharacterized protein [Littorina saxatilis]|uniref:uncharacterized protein n=1 Tax=Littorina saxatilis TaxID=31220 RepID=UPI0038B5FAC8
MDVTGLYTNIPHAEGLRAIQHFLSKSTLQIDPTIVVRLTELVLTLNAFSFGEHHFAQTRGVAMGTKMGPNYACLFVGHLEEQIFLAYKGPLPTLFKRFIDDCLGIAVCCKEDLLEFIKFVGDFNPAIKFTHEISESMLPFLDIQISITDSRSLETTVHYKRDSKLKDVFAKPPLVAYLKDTSLRDQLVHSSFQPSSGQTPGNRCCLKPKCKACPFLNTTTTTFNGPSGNSFTIRSSFTCQSTNVVYIITCSQCNKMYVGETYRTLAERLEEHVRAVRCQTDTPVGNHFNSNFHHLQHMSIAAVWQNHSDVVHRKFLETNLIMRLGTTKPLGLNIRE